MNKKQKNLVAKGVYPFMKGYSYVVDEEILKHKNDKDLKTIAIKNKKRYEDKSRSPFVRAYSKARYKVILKIIERRNIKRDVEEISSQKTSVGSSRIDSVIEEIYKRDEDESEDDENGDEDKEPDYEILTDRPFEANDKGYIKVKIKVDDRTEQLTFTEDSRLIDRKRV